VKPLAQGRNLGPALLDQPVERWIEPAVTQPALAERKFVLGIDDRCRDFAIKRIDAARAERAVSHDRQYSASVTLRPTSDSSSSTITRRSARPLR
jgi:hypothetical protein